MIAQQVLELLDRHRGTGATQALVQLAQRLVREQEHPVLVLGDQAAVHDVARLDKASPAPCLDPRDHARSILNPSLARSLLGTRVILLFDTFAVRALAEEALQTERERGYLQQQLARAQEAAVLTQTQLEDLQRKEMRLLREKGELQERCKDLQRELQELKNPTPDP